MPKIGFQILVGLALWLFSAQGQAAFASIPEATQLEEAPGFELKEATGHGLAYIDQRNTLNVEPGPQKEFPEFFSSYPAETSGSLENRKAVSAVNNLFLRDVRQSLTCQIFPFHFFW